MPRLSAWFVRAALVYLALGFTFGALMLANKGVPLHPALWRLLPAHIEFLLVGWTMQLALGVAFWILPRFWAEPPRGNEAGAWLAFGLLNLGVWLVGWGAVLAAPAGVIFLRRLAEIGAAVAFAAHAWPRIIPRN
ncbi:MAG: cbb3-type cytochrome c oxidase subunit I [Chloroflexi bacterium]|nr:cbb3-type cytochrome c oxidase subunit I [Chloroflexota bacterium]MCI0577827.1 cbb3-type cytochrome c oxidase subunit I [Chloroflexota bacterium]MCI0646124.1 cbb3-type cytochrome c oxidase subunit I [Chloroflexota bacterium]MCI0731689.1 cbb3-type cytochrome c oxidase subunit I [Chloroflexota bacterium]